MSCFCISASPHELTCAALPCMFSSAVCANVPICPAMNQHRSAFEHGRLCVPSAHIRVWLDVLTGHMLVCVQMPVRVCVRVRACVERQRCALGLGLCLRYKGHASRGDRTLINCVEKTDNVRVLLSPPHYLHWLNLTPLPPTPSFPICVAPHSLLNAPQSFLISTLPFILSFAHLRRLHRLSSPPLEVKYKKRFFTLKIFFPWTQNEFL